VGIFSVALAEMRSSGTRFRDPELFRGGYLERSGNKIHGSVASLISVDHLGKLDRELKDAGVMVFRLGGGSQGGSDQKGRTRFALAQCGEAGFKDYFLFDSDLFLSEKPRMFIPRVDMRSLFAFTLLPNFSETSLVSLAAFSGVLSEALELDRDAPLSAPATGQSTYTFSFAPREGKSPIWDHIDGQVEVDAILMGHRNGRPVAVIVESKAGESNAGSSKNTLAKHKLLYPYMALRPSIPDYIPIELVYLRAWRQTDGFHFRTAQFITEGSPNAIQGSRVLSRPRVAHIVLPLHSLAR